MLDNNSELYERLLVERTSGADFVGKKVLPVASTVDQSVDNRLSLRSVIRGLMAYLVGAMAIYLAIVATGSPLLVGGIICLSVACGSSFSYLFGGVAALFHDSAHGSLFTSKRINDFFGAFFGILMGNNLYIARPSHLAHHKYNQSARDPKDVNTVFRPATVGDYQRVHRIGAKLRTWLSPLLVSRTLRIGVMRLSLFFGLSLFFIFAHEGGLVGSVWRALVRPHHAVKVSNKVAAAIVWVLTVAVSCMLFLIAPEAFWTFLFCQILVSYGGGEVVLTHINTETINFFGRHDYWDALGNIRDINPGEFKSSLLFRFPEYHLAHHVAPSAPWYRLAELDQKLTKAFPGIRPKLTGDEAFYGLLDVWTENLAVINQGGCDMVFAGAPATHNTKEGKGEI